MKRPPMKFKLPAKLVSFMAESNSHIISLRGTIVILSIALAWCFYIIQKQPDELLVRIPPDLSNGAVMRAGDVPKSQVLVNTAVLWIELNTWMTNGQDDAYDNLNNYKHYIGERFKRELETQYNKLNKRGELERVRRVSLNPGTMADYDNRVIVKVKNQAWIVMLDVIVEDFYMNEPVQHVVVRYPLIVEAVETNERLNPIGMKIVGLADQARIIKQVED